MTSSCPDGSGHVKFKTILDVLKLFMNLMRYFYEKRIRFSSGQNDEEKILV